MKSEVREVVTMTRQLVRYLPILVDSDDHSGYHEHDFRQTEGWLNPQSPISEISRIVYVFYWTSSEFA
jgi:hypothetical protein